jgi:MoxR-like ATPase
MSYKTQIQTPPAQTSPQASPQAGSQTNHQTQTQHRVELARKRLLEVEATLNRLVIGHEEAVRALMLALVAREHVVLIGPPGTAKTMLAKYTAKLLDASCYVYLMTRFTVYDEIFGPVDVEALVKNNELRRRWSSITKADIVVLDEVFKANSAILNSLLSLMQERVVYDGVTGQEIRANLWTLIGASNEIPLDEELQALYDRFAVKSFIQYIDDAKMLTALMARWNSSILAHPIASMDDVRTLHEFAVTLLQKGKIKNMGEVLKLYHVNMVPMVRSLRAKGIVISDRMVLEKLAELYAARLALYGITEENVINAAYDIIMFAAKTPQEAAEIKKTIDDSLGEVAELSRKLEQAKAMLKNDEEGALKIFKEIASYDVSRLVAKPWLKPRVEAIVKVAQEYAQRTQEIIRQKKALMEG